MDAIILGGDHTKEELYVTKVKVKGNKYILKLKKKYMGEYVLEALLKSEYIDRVVIVTDKSKFKKNYKSKKKIIVVNQKGKITENFLEALEKIDYSSNKAILVLACDIPLITKDSVNLLIKEYKKYDSDIFIGLIPFKYFKGLLGLCVNNFQPVRIANNIIYCEKVNGLILKPKNIVTNNKLMHTAQIIYENRELESFRKQFQHTKFFPYIIKNYGLTGVLYAIYLYIVSRFLVNIGHNKSLYWLLPEKTDFEKKLSMKYKVNIGLVNDPSFSLDIDTESDRKGIEKILK